MSLILEALRKSEAERRRGRPPDLHAELPPVPTRGARRLPRWFGPLATFALIAAVGWALRDRLPATRPPLAASTSNSAPSPPSTQVRPAAPDVPSSMQARPAARPEAALPARTVSPERTSERTSEPTPSPPSIAAKTDGVAAPASAPAAPQPAAGMAAATGGPVMPIAEVDPQTRKALPPLKLTMHLWSQDPARRFVILDGQRLGEGDRIGEAVVTRIEPDGVVLDWQGRSLRVPLR